MAFRCLAKAGKSSLILFITGDRKQPSYDDGVEMCPSIKKRRKRERLDLLYYRQIM